MLFNARNIINLMKKFTKSALNRLFIGVQCLVTMMVISFSGFSQVAINTTLNPANASAGLDIDFSNKGFLITRTALTGLSSFTPFAAHVAGMITYNTATIADVTPGLYIDNGTEWVSFLPPNGVASGDMEYWNGTGWAVLPAGTTGQFLQISVGGLPSWGAGTVPILTTIAVTSITSTTASCGGVITNDSGTPVTARGVCWSTSAGPTVALPTKTLDGAGVGSFTSSLTGLTTLTIYHVRAYATNTAGTAYGNEVVFTTP
jgi:hypothetical protein